MVCLARPGGVLVETRMVRMMVRILCRSSGAMCRMPVRNLVGNAHPIGHSPVPGPLLVPPKHLQGFATPRTCSTTRSALHPVSAGAHVAAVPFRINGFVEDAEAGAATTGGRAGEPYEVAPSGLQRVGVHAETATVSLPAHVDPPLKTGHLAGDGTADA